jgi:hypothetical protein
MHDLSLRLPYGLVFNSPALGVEVLDVWLSRRQRKKVAVYMGMQTHLELSSNGNNAKKRFKKFIHLFLPEGDL